MLARIRKAAENKDSGFTLIELLVVMIIIGILAAIAIPAFLSQKKKANDTAAKADVTTIGKEIAAYYVDGTSTVSAFGSSASGGFSLAEGGATGTVFATGRLSNGVSVVDSNSNTSGAFCVATQFGQGTDDAGAFYTYRSGTGLQRSTVAVTAGDTACNTL